MAMPLFTIEQIELIRRLRNSGISKEHVIMAFNSLEKFEAEFGRPPIPSLPQNEHRRHTESPVGLIKVPHSNGLIQQQNSPYNNNNKINDHHPSFPRPQSNGNSNGTLENVSSSSNGDLSPTANSSVTSPTSKLPSELTIIPLSASSSSSSSSDHLTNHIENGISKPDNCLVLRNNDESIVPVHCLINPHELLQDEIAELEELTKRGDSEILSEIRNFVMRYNIKQTMIAEMTKMSQAYVSRFFRGDIQDMSDRTKHTFYMWYLTCKNNPWKLTQLCPNSGVKRMVSDNGDLIPLKRERFTFKASHLAVLERYYEKDPYPDSQTREQIVDECNRALSHLERPVGDRDRVTLPVVNNWFNNRRKEAKKQMRQHAAAKQAQSACANTPLLQALTTWSQAAFPTNLVMTNSMTESMESDCSSRDSVAAYPEMEDNGIVKQEM